VGLHNAMQSRREQLTMTAAGGASTLSPLGVLPGGEAADRDRLCDWLVGIGLYHVLPSLDACGARTLSDVAMLSNVGAGVHCLWVCVCPFVPVCVRVCVVRRAALWRASCPLAAWSWLSLLRVWEGFIGWPVDLNGVFMSSSEALCVCH
jgi:hypothetical protein